MRKVILPRCKEIGDLLVRLKSLYASGKKGPGGHASLFHEHAKTVTGLSTPSVKNYIQLAEGYHRLVDFMADLPEGATPITSLRGALEALRAMNRPIRPAITVEAQEVTERALGAGAGSRRTSYASDTRKKVLPVLASLRATSTLSDRRKAELRKIEEIVAAFLDAVEKEEEEACSAQEQEVEAPDPVEEELVAATEAAPAPEPQWSTEEAAERPASPFGKRVLAAQFPDTEAGLEALNAAIFAAGSNAELGRQLGVSGEAVRVYRKRLQVRLGAPT
jgi:hypothetical protein